MQTQLAPEFRDTPEGREAEAILRKCVHCGFCTATCPTYQLLGDELDSPRGRIYLIKQILEGAAPTRRTQVHLDRCLTCRNCESTCPSGVQYGRLLDIGRKQVEARVARPPGEAARRWALKEGLGSPLFAPALALGQTVRALLPPALQSKVPPRRRAGLWPRRRHPRKVLLLAGCVQPALAPNINAATARVLDAAGIETLVASAQCCGALKYHLNDQEGGLAQALANIAVWWPRVDSGEIEAIVMNASGCGLMVREYGHLLCDDPAWAAKAARISQCTLDLSELLPQLVPLLRERLRANAAADAGVLAYHPPCSLQHGQQLRGGVETGLRELGFDVRLAAGESHLCCGAGGTSSVLHPELALPLRERKLGYLQAVQPACIVSANIGCITHLQSGTALPVRHWVEVLDAALDGSCA
ncbi:MAG: glycolate oxidase subunit GlcF [Burkholderiaceae bacterium]|jgi:glycolate oxidase iron-sulfur subunit|nr:glycolate oxidase subunit GlcF [Burkholderiaceae bacterium]